MSTRGERRAARKAAEEERIRQDRERDQRFRARADAGTSEMMAIQRRAWARGDRTFFTGCVRVTGPDDRPVLIAIDRPGRYQEPAKGSFTEKLLNVLAVIPFMELVATAVVLLFLTSRWLFIELTGRPHFVITAHPDGGSEQVVARARRRPAAMRAATAAVDEVERAGTAALTPR
ncbi:hypothetical protein [Kitasatospora brasiliensis]|uniref:hypothetical protein n=1 Tax=Kitasatospora brasiliensis TaxID=3058040 RepID=UPI002930EBB0|nr:hypothetical protein [Kitasatospora sp. K002]